MPLYKWSPAWTATVADSGLRIAAGADVSFDTESIDRDDALSAVSWQSNDDFERPGDGDLQKLFDQLVVIGAVVPLLPSQDARFRVVWMGEPWNELLRGFAIADVGDLIVEEADQQLLIRTTDRWSPVMEQLESLSDMPYMFVDVAYHHTVSLGPYVIPGETACAGCLGGRLRERWGDVEPPPQPAVQTHALLIASLIRLELQRVAKGNPTLVNATSSWDLESGNSRREALYRVPQCPHCATASTGRRNLPWAH